MKTVVAHLKSISPYSQSKHYTTAPLDKESKKDYEVRTWRDRLHLDSDGKVFIPAMAFKNCLSEAAKYLSVQVPGKGKATYTKNIESGVMVTDGLKLPLTAAECDGEWLFLPSDGKRGGGKRVDKCYPLIREWRGGVTFYIMDETVTEDVFEKHLTEAGKFIGIGRWRPRNNGCYGRFVVSKFDWE